MVFLKKKDYYLVIMAHIGGFFLLWYHSWYGFRPKFAQKFILWAFFVTKPPIPGLSNIYKSWFFDENEQLFF